MRRLGRGLDALIHAVDSSEEFEGVPDGGVAPISVIEPLPWPVEHVDALTSTSLRLSVRSHLDKLSTRPRQGLKAARLYLDRLRQEDGRIHVSLDLTRVDLTRLTLIQLTRGRIVDEVRHSFFGLVSMWLGR